MPLPFLCKAVYFSFLDDKSTIITSDIKIPFSMIDEMQHVQNITFDSYGVEVSLPIADYDSAYMGTQNCLLLKKKNEDEILIYHIMQYKFVGKSMTIVAENTPYIINKPTLSVEGSGDDLKLLLNTQLPKNAISTFIEWGYAHDSVCKEDGTLNITSSKNADLYTTCYKGSCEIVKKRYPLVFDVCDNTSDSKYFGEHILYWVYIYVEPREYNISGTTVNVKGTYYGAPYDEGIMQLPYTILCYPVMEQNYAMTFNNIPLDDIAFSLFRATNQDTSYVYSLRISATPPSQALFYTIDRTNNTINLQTPSENLYNSNIYSLLDFTSAGLIQITHITKDPYKTTTILNSDMQDNGYPLGTQTGQVISKEDFKSVNNPYINLHTTKLRLTNSIGGTYDYSPVDLGLFYQIGFLIYDPLLIDNTNVFICVDTSYLTYSRFTQTTIEDYNGLLSIGNTNMVYSNDLLAQYIANNKNTYDTFYFKLNYGVLRNLSNGFASMSSKPIMGLQKSMWVPADTISQKNVFEDSMENLESARDTLNYTANNIFMGYALKGIGYFVEIVTTTDYVKDILYRQFVDRGINLDRYIADDRVSKYLSITDKDYDKANYKYVKASANLKSNDLYNTKQLLVYKNYLQNGVQMIKTDDIVVSESATNQDNVLNNISEEEIN